jgi:hypothetical protein
MSNEVYTHVSSARGVTITPSIPGAVYVTLEELESMAREVRGHVLKLHSPWEESPAVDPVPDGVPLDGFGVDRGATSREAA